MNTDTSNKALYTNTLSHTGVLLCP